MFKGSADTAVLVVIKDDAQCRAALWTAIQSDPKIFTKLAIKIHKVHREVQYIHFTSRFIHSPQTDNIPMFGLPIRVVVV